MGQSFALASAKSDKPAPAVIVRATPNSGLLRVQCLNTWEVVVQSACCAYVWAQINGKI